LTQFSGSGLVSSGNHGNALANYLAGRSDADVDLLAALVRIPSIASDGEAVRSITDELRNTIMEAGFDAKILRGPGLPAVFGQSPSRRRCPTFLFYGHYDVQPADPLSEWSSPPFEPTIRDERIYGRGVADDKGQMLCTIRGAAAAYAIQPDLPINVKFLFEGEEEIGSPTLRQLMKGHKSTLKADLMVGSDGWLDRSGRTTLILGWKGVLCVEIESRTPFPDLHSSQAPCYPSAAWNLTKLLSSMVDDKGRCRIPGFESDIIQDPDSDRLIAALPLPKLEPKEVAELRSGTAPHNFFLHMLGRPTCNIAGLSAGYMGPGFKTVLPSRAVARVDFRLVPDQEPDKILSLFRDFVASTDHTDIRVRKIIGHPPSQTPWGLAMTKRVVDAIHRSGEQDIVIFPRHEGTGPDYLFHEILGLPVYWLPAASDDCHMHGPDENMRILDLHNGISRIARLLLNFS
jgi:acetylornithine deacetylase/succinyl-diaminopimelate desuccinylase-like protein